MRCWEEVACGRPDCEAHDAENAPCWLFPANRCFDHPTCLTERLSTRCASCPVFAAHLARAGGKRAADGAVIGTMEGLLTECADLLTASEALKRDLRTKSAEATLLGEVGRALQSTMELDELLVVILTAVTAGAGLGFNRAFLIMFEEGQNRLNGRMAVGPTRPDEAETIWGAMRNEARSFGEILAGPPAGGRSGLGGIMGLARSISLPYDPGSDIVARSLEEGVAYTVEKARDMREARGIAEAIQSDGFIVMPLVAKGRKLGAIVADNFVTRRSISREDVRLLETLASQAALAILNASLHTRLQERLAQLEDAHRQLMQDQLQLLRAERLVAAGGLASTFVHEVPDGHKVREVLEKIAMEIIKVEDSLKHLVKSASGVGREARPVDVSSLVKESLDLLAGVAAEAGIEVAYRPGHRGALISGSVVGLRQMLLNIFHNSIEAMPEGGSLTVKTEVEGPMLRLTARDTGCGMPEDVRERVFSPFFTTKRGGSGLGLVIARRIATDHGGRLSFESKEGDGTCFHVLLPVAQPAPEEVDSKPR
jgi:signal transduction histidine kinase